MTNAQARAIGWIGEQDRNVVDGSISVLEVTGSDDVWVWWTCGSGSFRRVIDAAGETVREVRLR